jgi:hypothetical protein
MNPRNMLEHLRSQGILLKSYNIPESGEIFKPETVIFNKNFLHKYWQWSGELGFELWLNYPDYAYINGVNYTLKNVAKFYKSLEEFFYAYGRAIGFKLDKHKDILDILEWAKDENLIRENIGAFVINRGWIGLQKLKDSGFDGQTLKIDELI